MKAISIWQPYASLIAHGYKDVECRTWPTKYRGPLFILAAKQKPWPEDIQDAEALCLQLGYVPPTSYEIGGIVGIVHLSDCVIRSKSPWHNPGTYGFVLTQARPIPFIPYRGLQKLFNIEGLDHLLERYPPPAQEPQRSWKQRHWTLKVTEQL